MKCFGNIVTVYKHISKQGFDDRQWPGKASGEDSMANSDTARGIQASTDGALTLIGTFSAVQRES